MREGEEEACAWRDTGSHGEVSSNVMTRLDRGGEQNVWTAEGDGTGLGGGGGLSTSPPRCLRRALERDSSDRRGQGGASKQEEGDGAEGGRCVLEPTQYCRLPISLVLYRCRKYRYDGTPVRL
jgi:hypothetical protein